MRKNTKKKLSVFLAIALTAATMIPFKPVAQTQAGTITDLTAFDMEGFAKAGGVSGGGTIAETSSNYYKVSTAEALTRLLCKKNPTTNKEWTTEERPMVIEITQDIDLGWNLLSSTAQAYSSTAAANTPATHPTLKQTGMSVIYLDGLSNLTIYSKNGAKITHGNFDIKRSSNIMIRNLVFDEIWEWDDGGSYDSMDWDYFTIETNTEGVWIDHCTFGKAYDGIIDVKKASRNVTVSWCKFLDGEGTFFDAMMNELEANQSSYPNYKKARDNGVTAAQMKIYAKGQKKTHLIGHSDSDSDMALLNFTLANNYYKNPMDRLPRLRGGLSHVYNTYVDATDMAVLKEAIGDLLPSSLKISSNGAISTCGGSILLENCYFKDMNIPLRSNNTNPNTTALNGNVVALNTRYIASSVNRSWSEYSSVVPVVLKNINFLGNSTDTNSPLASFPTATSFDTQAFKNNLGYSYRLYSPDSLADNISSMGAGAISLTAAQWLQTSYSGGIVPTATPTVAPTTAPTATPTPTTAPTVTPVPSQSYQYIPDSSTNTSSYFTVGGSLTTNGGTQTYQGTSLTKGLKMDSSGTISFTTTKSGVTLIIGLNANKADCFKTQWKCY